MSNASGGSRVEIHSREGLNGPEHVPPLVGTVAVDVELAEVARSQHLAERAEALLQDLLPMRHEQQARIGLQASVAQALVVQRRDDGLAGSGGGDDQVLPAAVSLALGVQLLQHLR